MLLAAKTSQELGGQSLTKVLSAYRQAASEASVRIEVVSPRTSKPVNLQTRQGFEAAKRHQTAK